jgi:integrase
MPTVNLTATFVEKRKGNGKRIDYFDESLPGFSLRVTGKGVKTWCVSYRFAGKWTRFTFGTYPIIKLAEARETARDALHDVAHGINPATKKRADRNADTFQYLAHEYVERHAKLKKKSWQNDEWIITKYLNPEFGNTHAKGITRRDIRALLDRIAAKTPIMANRVRALLSKIYNWGILNEIVSANPAYLVPTPGKERQRETVLSEDEIKRFWKSLDQLREGEKRNRKYRLLTAASLKLRLLTAQRGGEVQSMQWDEIDLDSGWWTIPGSNTKNGLSHRVYLTAPAIRILDEARKLCESKSSPFVFQGPRGGHIGNVQKAIHKIRDITGIAFTGHDLRRTAATQMASNGIPRFTIQKILNHVEPGVTKIYDRYSYDAEKKEALEVWSRRLTILVSDLKEANSESGF